MLTVFLLALAVSLAVFGVWAIRKDPQGRRAIGWGGASLALAVLSVFGAFGMKTLPLIIATVVIVGFAAYVWYAKPEKTHKANNVTATASAMTVALVGLFALVLGSMSVSGPAPTQQAMSPLAIHHGGTYKVAPNGVNLVAFPTGTGDGEANEDWRQDLTANLDSNFIIEGLLTQQQIRDLPEWQQLTAARETLLVHAKHNVFLLTTSAKNAGLWDGDINNVGHLVTAADENGVQYLSREGRELFTAFEQWARSAKLSFELVSKNSVNTGFSEGGVSQSRGITGNLKALVLTKASKGVTHVVKVLVRCGNPVFDVDVAPPGHTDEQPPREVPPPPTKTTTTPPTTTPPTTTPPTTTPPTTTPPTTTPPTTTPPTSSTGKKPEEDPCKNGNGPSCPSSPSITADPTPSSPAVPSATTDHTPPPVPTAPTTTRTSTPPNQDAEPSAPATGASDPGDCDACGDAEPTTGGAVPTAPSPAAQTPQQTQPQATGTPQQTQQQPAQETATAPAASDPAVPTTTVSVKPTAFSPDGEPSASSAIGLVLGAALIGGMVLGPRRRKG